MSALDQITPLILTFNEEANIARCLDRLRWAKRVIVLDSGSTDATESLARGFANAELVRWPFDSFAEQCNFGLAQVQTPWVLSLDCDYVLNEGFEDEAALLIAEGTLAGYRAAFRYCIHGRPLSATLYPPRYVLYRKDLARYENEGHGHRVRISGHVGDMRSKIDHDDRKPLSRWLMSQIKYAQMEAVFLTNSSPESFSRTDKLRRLGWLMPLLAPVYCLFVKGLWRDGLAGWHYTLQRWLAECMIALALADRRLVECVAS